VGVLLQLLPERSLFVCVCLCSYCDRAVSCECVNVCDTAAAAAATTVGAAAAAAAVGIAAAAAVILHQNESVVTMPHSQKTDLLFQTVAHCALCCVNQP
jgi:hypothetical protein